MLVEIYRRALGRESPVARRLAPEDRESSALHPDLCDDNFVHY
jgi:hypothetical protein